MIKGAILVFLGACSFGILTTLVKLSYQEGFTLGEVTGVQVFFGMLILWVILLGRILIQKIKIKFTWKSSWRILLTGISTGLVSVFYYKSIQELPASIGILLLMQFTWISLLIEIVLHRKYPTPMQWVSVLFILFGTYLAGNVYSLENIPWSLEGIGYGLLAGFFYAVFIWANGRVGNKLVPVQKSALMITGSCMFIFLLFPPEFLWNGSLAKGLTEWGIIFALFGTVIPPLFFAYGIPKTGVSVSAILSSVELPVAVFFSSWLLAEKVTFLQWIGIVIILLAIGVSKLKGRQKFD
ncbi:DMT family transporter [Marivirga sp. S37H4]|uniref:DMT family transporter n=1 Tax=Marivirga aurantiaca TaxID=2802615 RepID=A0A935CA94_9BACT|nr:DMT family transporter [Marivirga aurantiaca]MBK6264688.1 DMT family transporter [Marivirga aurantiaca]